MEIYLAVLTIVKTCHVTAVLLRMSLPQHHLGQYNLCITGAVAEHKVKTFYCNGKKHV